jgi:fucokinase
LAPVSRRLAPFWHLFGTVLAPLQVLSAREYIATSKGADRVSTKWVVAEAAARIDLSGGWTDTPPLAYERGGAVANVSILIDGARPIGAKARRIEALKLIFVMGDEVLEITHLDQLRNYTQPQAPGALLKAGVCCARIVSLDSPLTLAEQLKANYNAGLELHTWSNLPTGSGLGTSSILAGAVMGALWKAGGIDSTSDDLVHAVLQLEQMMCVAMTTTLT